MLFPLTFLPSGAAHPVTGWAPGSIVALHYSEPNWPPGQVAPYQIQLDDGRLIYAPRYLVYAAADDDNNACYDDDNAYYDNDTDCYDDDSACYASIMLARMVIMLVMTMKMT